MNFEWIHVVIALVSAVVGAGTGLVAGVWRVARIESRVREDFKEEVAETKDAIDQKVETLVGQFQETFSGLRQKINDVELQTERLFVSKAGFEDFRKEYRQDFKSLMEKIDLMTMGRSRPRSST